MPLPYILFLALRLTLDLGYALCTVLGQPAAVAAALVLFVVAGLFLRTAMQVGTRPAAPVLSGKSRWVVALMLIAWSSAAYSLNNAPLHISRLQIAVIAVGAVALVYHLLVPDRGPASVRRLLYTAVILGIALRFASYPAVKIDPQDGDPMPLVLKALANLVAGHSPYDLYHFPWPLPLVYPPLSWLAYLPAYVLGVDIRVTNLVIELGIGAILLRVARRPGLVMQLWAFLFVGEAMLSWSLHNVHLVLWLLSVSTLALLAARRDVSAALLFGLTAAASPLAAVMAPFILIHLLYTRRFSWTARLCALSLAVAVAIYLPFYLWDREHFVLGLWRWHNTQSLLVTELWKLHNGGAQVGLNGLFDSLGWYSLMKPLQALAILAFAFGYARARGTLRLLGPFLTAAFIVFMNLNPLLRVHYFGIALFTALFSLALGAQDEKPATGRRL